MGIIQSHFKRWFGVKEVRVLMLGLDSAGKTTILYKLKLGGIIRTIPTIGFNVEKVRYKNIDFTVWDVGGQDKIRPLWKHYHGNTHGLIFVVDSSDRERIQTAKYELRTTLATPELSNSVLLVLANKQDLPDAMTPAYVANELGLSSVRDRSWNLQGTIATTGDGLYEGLEWVAKNIKQP